MLEGTGLLHLLHLFVSEPVIKVNNENLNPENIYSKFSFRFWNENHNVFVLLIKTLFGFPPFSQPRWFSNLAMAFSIQ